MLDDVPLSDGQLKTLALIIAVVASAIAAPMVMMPDSTQPKSSNGTVATPTPTPAKGTVQEFSGSDMASVPKSHMSVDASTPTSASPDVAASDGSQTMRVEVSGSGDDAQMVLSDEQTHDGRWVSVSASWLEATVGDVPEMVTVRHESGDTYQQPVRIVDDRARWWVEEFSTNTVTFSGEVTIRDEPASNGTKHVYDINDLDSASDINLTLTAATGTETDTRSARLTPGDSITENVAGNELASGVTLEVTGRPYSASWSVPGPSFSGSENWTKTINGVDRNVNQVTTPPIDMSDFDGVQSFSIYVNGEQKCAVSVGYQGPGERKTCSFSTVHVNDLTVKVVPQDGKDWHIDSGELEASGPNPSPTINVDGQTTSFGTLSDGETATESLNNLSTGSVSISHAGSTAPVDVTLTYTESITTSTDPTVEVNGVTAGYTGTLSDGESVERTISSSALQTGTNRVNITVGNSSLSADTPEQVVDIVYEHDAADDITTSYTSSATTESYNVSKSYASNRTNATLTIPFAGNVLAISSAEVRIDGGTWQSVGGSEMDLENTTLTVDISAVNGGDISAGSTVEVRATGLKLDVVNGSVTVTDPDTDGGEVTTTLTVDSRSDGFRLGVGDRRIRYVANSTYTAGDYYVADQQGQRLHLPNASAGDELTVSTYPVEVEPLSGAVRIDVNEVNENEPIFEVSPSGDSGQEVDYTFLNAQDGTEYLLYSQSEGVVRDSGTANSPLTLSDDDSEETLQFLVDDGNSASGGGGGGGSGGIGIVAAPSSDDFTSNLVPLSLVALAFAGLIIVSRNDDEVAQAGGRAADGIEGALGGIPVVGPAVGSVSAGVVRSAAQLGRALANNRTVTVALGGAVALAAIQSGVVQVPDSTLPLLVLVGVAAGSWVALRETGNWDMRLWVVIVGASTMVTLVTISDADPVAAITNSRVFPLLALGALYLGYRGVQALRAASQPDTTVVELQVDDSEARTDGGDNR